jgi:hypothetical protein
MEKNSQTELQRFASIQKILVFALVIIGTVVLALNIFSKTGTETGGNVSILDPAAQVRTQDNSLFGNIKISVEDELSLAYAQVLINGIDSGDFTDGELLVRVYPGDIVSIDGSAYQRELRFNITAISSNITQDYLQTIVYTQGNIVDAGIIVFK